MSSALIKFDRWLDREARRLSQDGSADIHIDDLLVDIDRGEWAASVVALLREIVAARVARLSGLALLVVIPLESTSAPRETPPLWNEVVRTTASTPPILYVMSRRVRDMKWGAERCVTPLVDRAPMAPDFILHLWSWRLPNDPKEDGWQQDVRIEHSFT